MSLLQAEVDNIIFIPATNSHFSITGTSDGMSYLLETPCPSGRMNIMPLRNIHANGGSASGITAGDLDVYVILKK